ncbi:hypothetical protein FRC01_007522, partial [Tulasnella sp. 417]
QFLSSATAQTYSSSSSGYGTIVAGVQQMADDFILINKQYSPSSGALSEQYTRSNGSPTSASDLTWSYAAALSAFNRRAGEVPTTWNSTGLTCGSTTTTTGTGTATTTTSTPTSTGGNTVPVTFKVYATTVWGENIFLTGSLSQLANWDPNNAVALSADTYPTWSVTVNLPASTTFQYKFIRKYNGAITWESNPNRSFTTPPYVINDTWR